MYIPLFGKIKRGGLRIKQSKALWVLEAKLVRDLTDSWLAIGYDGFTYFGDMPSKRSYAGTGAYSRNSPSLFKSLQSAAGISNLNLSNNLFISCGERGPGITLQTTSCPSGNCMAAAASSTLCATQTLRMSLALSTTSAGAAGQYAAVKRTTLR